MTKLIAITGRKQSGKDAVVNALHKIFPNKSIVRIGLADAVKDEICFMYGITKEYLNEHKENFRLIMQGHGTEYRRKLCRESYWIDQVLDMIDAHSKDADIIVVPDVRFHNEYKALKERDAIVWKVVREPSSLDMHQSEREMEEFPEPNYLIRNALSLQHLETLVRLAALSAKLL